MTVDEFGLGDWWPRPEQAADGAWIISRLALWSPARRGCDPMPVTEGVS
jgi:hypothetical protein